MAIPKLVFIVPYRNRENDKTHFEVYIKYLLEDIPKDDYEIYFSVQNDSRAFNRGAVKNLGFIAMREKYPDTYKDITFVFNDVDILPIKKNFLNFYTKHGIVKHFYGFDFTLGGIFSITGSDFEKTGGFPNFWGWGYEDNVINNRCIENKINIDRSNYYPVFDNNFVQTSIKYKKLLNNISPDINKCQDNNLNTITNIDYKINNNMIHINSFETIQKYSEQKFYKQDLSKERIPKNKQLLEELKNIKNRLNMRNMF